MVDSYWLTIQERHWGQPTMLTNLSTKGSLSFYDPVGTVSPVTDHFRSFSPLCSWWEVEGSGTVGVVWWNRAVEHTWSALVKNMWFPSSGSSAQHPASWKPKIIVPRLNAAAMLGMTWNIPFHWDGSTGKEENVCLSAMLLAQRVGCLLAMVLWKSPGMTDFLTPKEGGWEMVGKVVGLEPFPGLEP